MEHAEKVAADLAERANTLYWGSDQGVNSLAQDLELSKGALYDLIVPYPAGVSCPAGDGEMGYANRTARDRGFLTCPQCGLEDDEARVHERLSRGGRVPETEPPAVAPAAASRSLPVAVEPPRGALVGSALVGAALGFAVGRLVRRR